MQTETEFENIESFKNGYFYQTMINICLNWKRKSNNVLYESKDEQK